MIFAVLDVWVTACRR